MLFVDTNDEEKVQAPSFSPHMHAHIRWCHCFSSHGYSRNLVDIHVQCTVIYTWYSLIRMKQFAKSASYMRPKTLFTCTYSGTKDMYIHMYNFIGL